MITLVCGSPNSGKSARAEELFSETKAEYKYYVATMQVFDEEGRKRVEKHRRAREGKGFITLEIPTKADSALSRIKDGAHSAVLLECLSNLAGNEMHEAGDFDPDAFEAGFDQLTERIVNDIVTLSEAVTQLIIVANMFKEDDEMYDEETKAYVRLNNTLTRKIRHLADKVVDI